MYVPFLKPKKGELDALQVASAAVKSNMMPLFELCPPGQKNADDAITEQMRNIVEGWGTGPCYLDGTTYYGEGASSGEDAFAFALQLARDLGMQVVPVVGSISPRAYLSSARASVRRDHRGVGLRVRRHDIGTQLRDWLPSAMGGLGVGTSDTDVLLDWGAVNEGEEGFVAFTYQGLLTQTPALPAMRRLVLAASGFPESLKAVGQDATVMLPRTEWLAWTSIADSPETLVVPIFGDYAPANPRFPEGDPQNMAVTANIRYTTDRDWLVVRGRPIKGNGFSQMREMAQIIVDHPSYSGPDFSWGDSFINDCARGEGGTGNATTWVKVRTSHHAAFVTRQLANRRAA